MLSYSNVDECCDGGRAALPDLALQYGGNASGPEGGGADLEEHQQRPTNSISHSSHLDLFPVILH